MRKLLPFENCITIVLSSVFDNKSLTMTRSVCWVKRPQSPERFTHIYIQYCFILDLRVCSAKFGFQEFKASWLILLGLMLKMIYNST